MLLQTAQFCLRRKKKENIWKQGTTNVRIKVKESVADPLDNNLPPILLSSF